MRRKKEKEGIERLDGQTVQRVKDGQDQRGQGQSQIRVWYYLTRWHDSCEDVDGGTGGGKDTDWFAPPCLGKRGGVCGWLVFQLRLNFAGAATGLVSLCMYLMTSAPASWAGCSSKWKYQLI